MLLLLRVIVKGCPSWCRCPCPSWARGLREAEGKLFL